MAKFEGVEVAAPEDPAVQEPAFAGHGGSPGFGGPPRKLSQLPSRRIPTKSEEQSYWRRLWEADPPILRLRLVDRTPWPGVPRMARAFLTSSFLHSAVVFFIYCVPIAAVLSWLFGIPPLGNQLPPPTLTVMVDVRHLHMANHLPGYQTSIHAPVSGRGAKPGPAAALGSSHYDPRVTIISNSPYPDNDTFTLKTENAPPDLKPPVNSKLPDLILGSSSQLPAPPLIAPSAVDKASIPRNLPGLAASSPPAPPFVTLSLQLPQLTTPALEVPLPPPPGKSPPASSAPQAPEGESVFPSGQGGAGEASRAGGEPKVLSLSIAPTPVSDRVAIPAGERSAAFTISPAETTSGMAGDSPAAQPGGGTGGTGPAGDRSAPVGNAPAATPGGGGREGSESGSSAGPPVSVSGPGSSRGITSGTLPPLKPEDLVYAVKPETPKAHAPGVLVSGGVWGGGGLRVYGVLQGGRIYTVYFSMPGKSWVLEYCAQEAPVEVDPYARRVQVHMEAPLIAPAAIEQYDFHRAAAQRPDADPAVILHGIIHEDGTVSDLAIVQGADATNNAAAATAFARWKFRPAMRGDKPVAVEVLLGIP